MLRITAARRSFVWLLAFAMVLGPVASAAAASADGTEDRVLERIAELEALLTEFEASGAVQTPLAKQLGNALKQARHHYQKGSLQQADKKLDDYLKHLHNGAMQKFITAEAKEQLDAAAHDIKDALAYMAAPALVSDGVANADILLGTRADQLEMLAAQELQDTVKMISGAELPIVKGDLDGDGLSVQLRDAVLLPTESGDYSFRIDLINNGGVSAQVSFVQADEGALRIEPLPELTVEAGEAVSVPGTLHVPRGTADGVYTVEILPTVQAGGSGQALEPLRLTVRLDRNLIFNPGMELGLDGWFAPPGVIELDETTAHSGNRSLAMVGGGYFLNDRRQVLQPGQEYVYKAWLKGEQPGTASVEFRHLKNGTDVLDYKITHRIEFGDDWTYVEIPYVRNPEQEYDFNWISIWYGGASGTLWVDDVSLSKVEKAPLHGYLQGGRLDVKESGEYPLKLVLANDTDQPLQVTVTQTDGAPLTVGPIAPVDVPPRGAAVVDGMLHVPAAAAEGEYTVELALEADGMTPGESGSDPIVFAVLLDRNLIYNSSFELGMDGWYAAASVGRIDETTARTGTKSLEMFAAGYSRTDRRLLLEPGKDYLFTAWVKGENPGTIGVEFRHMHNGNDVLAAKVSRTVNYDVDWTLIELPYTLNPDYPYDFTWINFWHNARSGNIWIDDVAFVPVESSAAGAADGGLTTEEGLTTKEGLTTEDRPTSEEGLTSEDGPTADEGLAPDTGLADGEQTAAGDGLTTADDAAEGATADEEPAAEERPNADGWPVEDPFSTEGSAPEQAGAEAGEVTALSAGGTTGERLQLVLATPQTYPALAQLFADDLAFLDGSDGFAVRQIGNRIYIFGSEPRGVLNGVYDFLEENAGILWTRSTDVGTIYEPQATIKAVKADYREKSPFSVRGWHTTGTGVNGEFHWDYGTVQMFARNKLNAKFAEFGNLQYWDEQESLGIRAVNLGHNLGYWLPNEEFFDEHPEYYNWENGRYVPVSGSTQINFYHPDVPYIIAEKVKQFHDRYGTEYIGIGINDNQNFTQSEESRQPFTTPDGTVVDPDDPAYKSTVFFTFMNKLAAEVKRTHPNVKIVTYAYFFTEVPPKVDLEDNIVVVMAPIREDARLPINTDNTASNNYQYKLMMEEWAAKTKNIIMYNYYGCCYANAYERPIAEKVQADAQFYRDLGIMGFLPEGVVDANRTAWGVNALQFWLFHKIFWDPDADIEALKNEFIQKAYGAAAEPMKRYYDLIEQGWNYDQQPINIYSNEKQLIGQYIIKAGIKDAAQSALDEAWALAGERERARIEPIRTTFMEMVALHGEKPDLSAVAVKTDASKETILQSLDFSTGPWTAAEPVTDFYIMRTTNPAPVETKVYLLWDDENLYVGYENFDDDPSRMVVSDSAPGGWWASGADDSVETHLIAEEGGSTYAFFTNPNAINFVYKSGPTYLPDLTFESNAVTLADRWNVVQVIPFADFGMDPQTDREFTALLFRNYHGADGYFAWGGGVVWSPADQLPVQLVE